MGITIIKDGVIVDRPAEENDSDSAGDGRSYLPFISKTHYQDGSVSQTTDRVDIGGRPLPASGNVTQILGAPKTTEAENPTVASVRQAKVVTDAALNLVQSARDSEYQRIIDQQAQNAAAIASATNLQQTSSPVTGARQWTVKPTERETV